MSKPESKAFRVACRMLLIYIAVLTRCLIVTWESGMPGQSLV